MLEAFIACEDADRGLVRLFFVLSRPDYLSGKPALWDDPRIPADQVGAAISRSSGSAVTYHATSRLIR